MIFVSIGPRIWPFSYKSACIREILTCYHMTHCMNQFISHSFRQIFSVIERLRSCSFISTLSSSAISGYHSRFNLPCWGAQASLNIAPYSAIGLSKTLICRSPCQPLFALLKTAFMPSQFHIPQSRRARTLTHFPLGHHSTALTLVPENSPSVSPCT